MRYMVQSYTRVRGRIEPGYGQFLRDRQQAMAAAQRIMRSRDGVLVLEQEENLFGEGEGDLRVIARFGAVPPACDQRIAA